MVKVETMRLRSVIYVFWVCLFAIVPVNTFAGMPSENGESVSFEVLNPEAEMMMASKISYISPRIKDLSGRNIGLVWAGKSGGEFFLDALGAVLKKKYPSATISRYTRGACWKAGRPQFPKTIILP